ncbi:MAG: putative pit accessory protein [Chloroflexi bacterium ADurb.Bin325]|nr:MAG: putative pit accessory protein [Chloroflexi bacterium ADurb.Bin325]
MRFSFLPVEVRFFDHFQQATANLLDGARVLQQICNDYRNIETLAARLDEIEHQGDFIVHEVTNLLPRTLITPFDPVDIQRLIDSIDDALDTIHAAVMRMSTYQVTEIRTPAARLAQLIVEGATELDLAIKDLQNKKQYSRVKERIVQINTLENLGDRVLEEGLRNLSTHRDDLFDFIRWKEIYELLEQSTDRLEDASDVIQRVMIANA